MKLNPRVTQIILSEMNEDLRMKLKIDRAKKCEEMLIDNQLVVYSQILGNILM